MVEALVKLAEKLGWRLTVVKARGWEDNQKVLLRTLEGEVISEEEAVREIVKLMGVC